MKAQMVKEQNDHATAPDEETSSTPAEVFALVWSELTQILGSSATAALLRRSGKNAMTKHSELEELAITRKGFEYSYTVPQAWKSVHDSKPLRALLSELYGLLSELTGSVVIRKLRAQPVLVKYGFDSSQDEQ